MSATTSRIHIDPPRQHAAMVHWEGELLTPSGERRRIYFEFSTPDDRPYPMRARPFLLTFLLPAMSAGAPLELDFPIDAVTLNHLMEWQEAMASWAPQTLKVVPIRAPINAQPDAPREPGALTAFSGGVDSNFTAWRNTRNAESSPFHTAPLQAGLMVHGFDIPLDQPPVFESAWNRSNKMLEAFGLTGYRLRTNLRSLDGLPGCAWDKYSHGIWLAAALACYEPWFGRILIPSTFPYPKLILPWGSNPLTDPLFSSATTTYWHDGAAYSKLTKMQAIAHLPVVQQLLRVCWEGAQLDRNCGKCFKCVATWVCFQLSGWDRTEAFPGPCTLKQVADVPVKNEQNDWLLRSMCSEAERQGKPELARAIKYALKHAKRKPRWRHIKKLIRHFRK